MKITKKELNSMIHKMIEESLAKKPNTDDYAISLVKTKNGDSQEFPTWSVKLKPSKQFIKDGGNPDIIVLANVISSVFWGDYIYNTLEGYTSGGSKGQEVGDTIASGRKTPYLNDRWKEHIISMLDKKDIEKLNFKTAGDATNAKIKQQLS